MNPIAFGQPAAHVSSASGTPVAAVSVTSPAASADDLRAEDAAAAASVGALETYAARFSSPPAAPETPTTTPDPTTMVPPLQASTGSTSAPFSPARSWSSMVGQNGPGGTPAGSAADQGMSQILDAGDVFDANDD